jgi:hypothetical protein
MDDKKRNTKVEQRDGKLFVEGQKHAYFQGMIRTLRLSASDLHFKRSLYRNPRDGAVHAFYMLAGKAHLDDDALSIIANKGERTEALSLILKAWPKSDPSQAKAEADQKKTEKELAPWRGVLGFIDYDWEIGRPSEWFAEVYLPPPILDEVVTSCRRRSLGTVSLGFDTDLWVSENDQHAPPSMAITWYLAPGKYDADVARLTLKDFDWTEKPLPLSSSTDQNGQEKGEEARRERFEAEQLAAAKRVGKALYFVGAMLALVVLILAFK